MTKPSGVAVVIPAFNAEAFLGAALASVASQRVRPAEVVVVDDGSSDRTAAVAGAWCDLLPLKVVHQQNAGPAAARRRGLSATTAPLVALLDADDIWFPNHLETLVGAHHAHGGVISGNGIRWRPGQVGRLITHAHRLPVPPHEAQPMQILDHNFVFIGALFARSDYQLVEGFRDGWSGAEDWDLWIQMIRAGVRVCGVTEPTSLYRMVSTGLTHQLSIVERYIAVLDQALREVRAADERAAIGRSIRRYKSRLHFGRALAAADGEQVKLARREARQALGGSPAVTCQAAAVLLVPRAASAFRAKFDRLRWG